MDVLGYVRVSTAEQAHSGAGLEAQRRAIRRACKAREWVLTAIYEDAGVSGKAVDRPGLDQALEAVEGGTARRWWLPRSTACLDRWSSSPS